MGQIGFMYICTCKYCGDQGFVHCTVLGDEKDICPECIKVDDKSSVKKRFEYKTKEPTDKWITKFSINGNCYLNYVEDRKLYNMYLLKVYDYGN